MRYGRHWASYAAASVPENAPTTSAMTAISSQRENTLAIRRCGVSVEPTGRVAAAIQSPYFTFEPDCSVLRFFRRMEDRINARLYDVFAYRAGLGTLEIAGYAWLGRPL